LKKEKRRSSFAMISEEKREKEAAFEPIASSYAAIAVESVNTAFPVPEDSGGFSGWEGEEQRLSEGGGGGGGSEAYHPLRQTLARQEAISQQQQAREAEASGMEVDLGDVDEARRQEISGLSVDLDLDSTTEEEAKIVRNDNWDLDDVEGSSDDW